MGEAIIVYAQRDNMKALSRSIGDMIVTDEATISDAGGIYRGEEEVLPPHSFRISIEADGTLNVRVRGKN